MDKLIRPNGFTPLVVERVNYGELDSVPVDQAHAQNFNIDHSTGFPIDDISAILRADSQTQRIKLSELTEFKSEFLSEDITDEAALKYYQPRLVQMPSELAELAEDIAKQRWEEYKKDKEVKDSEEEAKLYKNWLENYLKSQKSATKVEPIKPE